MEEEKAKGCGDRQEAQKKPTAMEEETVGDREEAQKMPTAMEEETAKVCGDREEAQMKLAAMEEETARGCGDREKAQKKPTAMEKRARGCGDPEEAHKKPKLGPLMDAVVSGDSSRNGAPDHSEPSPKKFGVVYFKHGLAVSGHTQLRVLKPQFDKFGAVVNGPIPLSIPQDYAYLIYQTPDEAQKAVEEGGRDLLCSNTDGAILEAVRQDVLGQVRPLLDQAAAHPSNTSVFISNLYYESTPEEIRSFFSQFGEIVEGPIVFDLEPDADMMFCLIIYKDKEGAKQAISHPNKDLRGYQLVCSADIEDIINLSQQQLLHDVRMSLRYSEAMMRKGAANHYTPSHHSPKQASGAAIQNTPLHHSPKLASALNDAVLAAERLNKAAPERLNKAADVALEAAERFNRAASLMKMPSPTDTT